MQTITLNCSLFSCRSLHRGGNLIGQLIGLLFKQPANSCEVVGIFLVHPSVRQTWRRNRESTLLLLLLLGLVLLVLFKSQILSGTSNYIHYGWLLKWIVVGLVLLSVYLPLSRVPALAHALSGRQYFGEKQTLHGPLQFRTLIEPTIQCILSTQIPPSLPLRQLTTISHSTNDCNNIQVAVA